MILFLAFVMECIHYSFVLADCICGYCEWPWVSCNSHKVTAMASRNHCNDDALLPLAINGSGVTLACTTRVAAIAKGSSVKRNTVVTDRCEAQEEKPDGMYVVDDRK
ncbi:hypothetical protein V8C44DRAFT_319077 [Trichoderma aethiopicum]